MNEKFEKYRAARIAEVLEDVGFYNSLETQAEILAERIVDLEAKLLAVDGIIGKDTFDTVLFISRQEAKEEE